MEANCRRSSAHDAQSTSAMPESLTALECRMPRRGSVSNPASSVSLLGRRLHPVARLGPDLLGSRSERGLDLPDVGHAVVIKEVSSGDALQQGGLVALRFDHAADDVLT